MFYLHRRTRFGVYHLMGDFETDCVQYAFRDCVNNHTDNYVWITTDADVPYNFNFIAYDPDHDNYLDVDDWDYSILQTALV